MDKLEEAIDKILSDADPDPWTKLCIATIKLGTALAEFENAKKAYVKSNVSHNSETAKESRS